MAPLAAAVAAVAWTRTSFAGESHSHYDLRVRFAALSTLLASGVGLLSGLISLLRGTEDGRLGILPVALIGLLLSVVVGVLALFAWAMLGTRC